MTIKRNAEWLLVGTILFGALIYGSAHLQSGLDAEQRLTAKRLAHAFIPLMTEAHHAQDDLELERVAMALAQSPGVSNVGVLDLSDHVLAHNRLSEIGKTFDASVSLDDLHRYALREGAEHWGTLAFILSQRSLHHLWLEWVLIFTLGIVALIIGYGARLHIEHKRLAKLRELLREQNALNEDRQNRIQQLEQRLSQSQLQARSGFQTLLAHDADAVLLLDDQQRVVAFNAEAGRLLCLAQKEMASPVSWQDIPWLQDQGVALEQSLNTRGTDIEIKDLRYEGIFRTEKMWTLVKPRPALRVYPEPRSSLDISSPQHLPDETRA